MNITKEDVYKLRELSQRIIKILYEMGKGENENIENIEKCVVELFTSAMEFDIFTLLLETQLGLEKYKKTPENKSDLDMSRFVQDICE